MAKVTVLNMDIPSGWLLRARTLDTKVTSRPGRFGDEIYLIKRDGTYVEVTQNSRAGRLLDVSNFNAAQMGIINDLKMCSLIKDDVRA